MKKWLALCLFFWTQVYGAAVRDHVHDIVAKNNANVHRTKSLYAYLPAPAVNIVFEYLRIKLTVRNFDSKYTRDSSVQIIDQHGNKHYLVVAGYLPTRARKYMSIACIEKNALDPLVEAVSMMGSIENVEEKFKVRRDEEMAYYTSFFTYLTFPGKEEIDLAREEFGPHFIVGYEELRQKFAKAQEDES